MKQPCHKCGENDVEVEVDFCVKETDKWLGNIQLCWPCANEFAKSCGSELDAPEE